jgi:acyl carrier protein
MLRQLIDKFLLERTEISAEKLADPTLKMADLGVDSLGIVEMLFEVEDQYGIHMEDVTKFQHMTLNEVVQYMEQIIRDKNGGQWPEENKIAKAGHSA